MTENARAAAVSADGTVIAFDAWGEGEPLIIIDGSTAYPAINPLNAEIAKLLDGEFRTYTYDRRGRGDSTDTPPYAVEREIEDLAALIEIAGAPATLFGWSSGAVLALDAAAAGLPVRRLALFEPPFLVDDSRPPVPDDYVARLEAAIAEGRPGDAFAIFLIDATGATPEQVEELRKADFWPVMEAVAPTLSYDGRIMGSTMSGNPLPKDRWAAVTVPTLVMHGTDTFPGLVPGARALGELLPNATVREVDGQQHSAPAHVLAAELRAFER